MEKYLFSQSLCEFLTYVVLTLALFVIYYVISRLVGFCISQDKGKTAAIEKIGGATFGVVRSVIIIGIFVTGFILTPSKFVEKSVKDSFTGVFFININLRIYNTAMDLVFRDDKISHRKTLEQFISEKKDYPFKTLDLREKSKFFKKEKEE